MSFGQMGGGVDTALAPPEVVTPTHSGSQRNSKRCSCMACCPFSVCLCLFALNRVSYTRADLELVTEPDALPDALQSLTLLLPLLQCRHSGHGLSLILLQSKTDVFSYRVTLV